MKTYVPKGSEIEHQWYIVDATGQSLGRLSTDIARVLRGKHKPSYTPNADVGDYVVVINAEKLAFTGKRLEEKLYRRHSGYPGGLRTVPLGTMLKKHPERVLETAVRGMLPHNHLGEAMFKKLKVYARADHPHGAQQPRQLSELLAGQPTGAKFDSSED